MKLRMHRLAGLILGAVVATWSAASAADCQAPATEREVLGYVSERIQPLLAVDQVRLELSPMGTLPMMAAPQVRLLTQGLRSRVAVELKGTLCGQDRPSVVTVWFKVRALRDIWVYGRNARGEQEVANAEPKRQEVDIAALQIASGELIEAWEGQWLRQSVNAGLPILKRHVQDPPLIQRDARVKVMVYGPGLMLQAQGRAMRPGLLGDTVPVLVDGAESSLLAVITGKGEVHVQR